MNRRIKVSIAVFPALACSALLIISWLAAVLYFPQVKNEVPSPFTEVWAWYSEIGSAKVLGVALAGLLVSCMFPAQGPRTMDSIRGLSHKITERPGVWSFVASLGIAVQVIAKGPYLFEAPSYLAFSAPAYLVSVANLLAPVTSVASGIVSTRYQSLGYLFLGLAMIVSFGYSSRMFALLPLAYLCGRWLARADDRIMPWMIGIVAAVVLLPVPLFTRGLGAHGISPYWQAVVSDLGRVYERGYFELLGNVGFTAPLAQFVVERAPEIPPVAIMASLDPGIGSFGLWSMWGETLRVHKYIPYSMIGEFGRGGMFQLFIAFLIWGLICRVTISTITKDASMLGSLSLTVALGLTLLSTLYIMQYNTRSVARIMWLVIAIAVFSALRAALQRAYSSRGQLTTPKRN